MSNYDELKRELHQLNRSISSKNQEIKTTENELVTIEQERAAAKSNSESQKQTDYQAKYQQHVDSILNPINLQINEIKKDIADEDASFNAEFAELTDDAFMSRCTDTQDLLAQLQDMSKKLGLQLQDLIGARLYKSVSKNLKDAKMELGVDNLQKAIVYFNECEIKTEAMLSKKDYIGDGLKKMESGLQALELNSVNSKGAMIIMALAVTIIFLILYKTIFPIYMILILVLSVFHVMRTYSVYEVLLIQKSIIDNIDGIAAQLREEALEAAASARAELQGEHQARATELENKLQELTDKQVNALNAAKDSFSYDGALIQSSLDGKMVNLEKREADAIERKRILQRELDELMKQLAERKQEMQSVFSSQQTAYLNYEKAGESFILNTQFLLDIDDITQKISYFNFPCESSLFLYKDHEEAINFIKLLNVQIRSRLHPSAYEVVYFDQINIGQDCFFFVPEVKDKNDPAKRIFRIVSTQEDLANEIEAYATEMKSRQQNFGREKSIDDYNRKMLDIGSITMPYYFAFIMDPDDQVIQKLGIVTRAASSYGIYVSVFVQESKFASWGNNIKRILELFSVFYLMQNGKVNTRAKDFLATTYCPDK